MSTHENNKRRGHEQTDWNLRWVFWGGITLIASVVVMLAASWWLFRELQSSAVDRPMGTAVAPPVEPPEPRLQVSPYEDWKVMLQREQAILHSYGWIDRSRGIVHIPIEREMELIAQRGFPAAKAVEGQTK